MTTLNEIALTAYVAADTLEGRVARLPPSTPWEHTVLVKTLEIMTARVHQLGASRQVDAAIRANHTDEAKRLLEDLEGQ